MVLECASCGCPLQPLNPDAGYVAQARQAGKAMRLEDWVDAAQFAHWHIVHPELPVPPPLTVVLPAGGGGESDA
jgi:hypothetical protein